MDEVNMPFAPPAKPSHYCDMMPLKKFNPHGEQTNIGERWKKQKRGFEIYLMSTDLKDENMKK